MEEDVFELPIIGLNKKTILCANNFECLHVWGSGWASLEVWLTTWIYLGVLWDKYGLSWKGHVHECVGMCVEYCYLVMLPGWVLHRQPDLERPEAVHCSPTSRPSTPSSPQCFIRPPALRMFFPLSDWTGCKGSLSLSVSQSSTYHIALNDYYTPTTAAPFGGVYLCLLYRLLA